MLLNDIWGGNKFYILSFVTRMFLFPVLMRQAGNISLQFQLALTGYL